MSKLQHNGIRGVMLSWFKSYLSNRNQHVSVKSSSSSMSNLHWVFRKAHCWAQYFFFCTSMTCIDPQTSCALFIHFADDTTVFASDSDINNVHSSVNRLKTNRLSPNISKTSYMIISNQKSALYIKIQETILTKVSTVKFLGVTLAENLNFKDHVNKDRGRVDDLSLIHYLSPFCLLLSEFHCIFPFLIKYYRSLFIIIVFWLGCDRPLGHFFFRARLLFSILTPLFLPPSSISLSYFILAVPMSKCLGKHSCMSSPFPIAILNGTFFFRSVNSMNNWKRSAIKQILLLLLLLLLLTWSFKLIK